MRSSHHDTVSPNTPSLNLEPQNILVIRLARMGDVILMEPAVRALRQRFPGARLSVLTGHRCAPIAEMYPCADEVIGVDRIALRDAADKTESIRAMFDLALNLRRREFDLVVDLHSFRETHLLTWFTNARVRLAMKRTNAPYWNFCFTEKPVLEDKSVHVTEKFVRVVEPLGARVVSFEPRLVPPAESFAWAGEFLSERGVEVRRGLEKAIADTERSPVEWGDMRKTSPPLIGLNLGVGAAHRAGAPELFGALAEVVAARLGARPVLFAGPAERDLASQVASQIQKSSPLVVDRFSLKQVAALMAHCVTLISNDTGPMHLAPAVGVPAIGLFKRGHPSEYRPLGAHSSFIQIREGEEISVEAVFQRVKRILEQQPAQ